MKTKIEENENQQSCLSPVSSSYNVGDIAPYLNTRSNQKDAEITSFKAVENGKIWFYGIDTVTKAKVFYPVHLSLELKRKTPSGHIIRDGQITTPAIEKLADESIYAQKSVDTGYF